MQGAHMPQYLKIPVDFLGIYDVNKNQAKAALKRYEYVRAEVKGEDSRSEPLPKIYESIDESIKDDVVSIFRPYVHIGDFEYTGGVLHYIGTEMVRDFVNTSRMFTVDAYTHQQMTKEGALK